jgi:ABC-type uncharacterized transport system permease subunit
MAGRPLPIVAAAFLLAVITAGGDILQMTQALPASVANILMAVILFVVPGVAGARHDRHLAQLPVGRDPLGTPLLYATVAEIIGERAGVVNLGLEGVMLMGAVAAFATMVQTGQRGGRGGGRRPRRNALQPDLRVPGHHSACDQLASGLAPCSAGWG